MARDASGAGGRAHAALGGLARGLAMRCPACGHGGVFRGFIDIKPVCPHCAAPLGRVRLELLRSYLTILLDLGVMGTVMIVSAFLWHSGLVRFIAVFAPLCILFELAIVRPVRALMLAAMLKMNVLRLRARHGMRVETEEIGRFLKKAAQKLL